MTVTEFLTRHCRGKLKTLKELYPAAKTELLRKGEGKAEFLRLISSWMGRHSDGLMSNGLCFYTELPIDPAQRSWCARVNNKNVAIIMVGRPM